MKTAPFDREPPFVLLPQKPKGFWRKLVHCLRFGFGKSQCDTIDSEFKGLDALQSRSKVGGSNDFVSGLAASNTYNGAGDYFDNRYSTLNTVGGHNVKINNRCIGVPGDLDRLAAHKAILIFVNEAGEAYALDGSKWSRK